MMLSLSFRFARAVSTGAQLNVCHQACRSLQTYQFGISAQDLDTVKATLPLVAEAGTDFTKHFYGRMFAANPFLLNIFNQTNQAIGGQPKKLLKTVAVAAQAAIDTGELPGEAIEGICHKHAALHVTPEAYGIVGENLLGTIEDLFTDDAAVLQAWGSLYGDIANVFISREKELADAAASVPGGWSGRRTFVLERKEKVSSIVTRFKFRPVDGQPVTVFKPGQYTTIWQKVDAEGPYGHYTEQPRHYTLAVPRNPADVGHTYSVSIKKDGLVSNLLHQAAVGTEFELSTPYGCFDLSGAENLWLTDNAVPIVFISAGVGITPVLAMLENIYVTRPATWLHADKSGDQHAYRDRLRHIAAVRDGDLQRRVWYTDPLPEDGPPGGNEDSLALYNLAKYHYEGRMQLPDAVKDTKHKSNEILHLDNKKTQYYMCGPEPFMDDQKEALLSLGVDGERIHWERFT